jgi:hypothetical protein
MDFPAYVPAAVRAYITALIEGDSWRADGVAGIPSECRAPVRRNRRKIQSDIRLGKEKHLSDLRNERAEAVAHRDSLKAEVDCLRRLAHDGRMREAYAILTREFADDRQWRGFIYSAWAARVDFAKYRDRLKQAAELMGEIAQAAETLAKLIRQFSATGINGPSEFYSIPELLRQTDNDEMQEHNLHMWRSMRRYVLGDPPLDEKPEITPRGKGAKYAALRMGNRP